WETASEDEIFGHKPAKGRQTQRSQTGNGEDNDQSGHPFGNATKNVDFAGMGFIVDHAYTEEEQTGDAAVSEHLQGCAGESGLLEGKITGTHCPSGGGHAEQDVPHMANAGVGDHLLHVALNHRDACAIEDVDSCQGTEPPGKIMCGSGEEAQTDAN